MAGKQECGSIRAEANSVLTIGIFAFWSVVSSVFLIDIFCEPMEYICVGLQNWTGY